MNSRHFSVLRKVLPRVRAVYFAALYSYHELRESYDRKNEHLSKYIPNSTLPFQTNPLAIKTWWNSMIYVYNFAITCMTCDHRRPNPLRAHMETIQALTSIHRCTQRYNPPALFPTPILLLSMLFCDDCKPWTA